MGLSRRKFDKFPHSMLQRNYWKDQFLDDGLLMCRALWIIDKIHATILCSFGFKSKLYTHGISCFSYNLLYIKCLSNVYRDLTVTACRWTFIQINVLEIHIKYCIGTIDILLIFKRRLCDRKKNLTIF
jgi:hypothetical protein